MLLPSFHIVVTLIFFGLNLTASKKKFSNGGSLTNLTAKSIGIEKSRTSRSRVLSGISGSDFRIRSTLITFRFSDSGPSNVRRNGGRFGSGMNLEISKKNISGELLFTKDKLKLDEISNLTSNHQKKY
jgi:hypothetical protein